MFELFEIEELANQVNFSSLYEIAKKSAQIGNEILKVNYNKIQKISSKGRKGDLVTNVDLEIENKLKVLFPFPEKFTDHGVSTIGYEDQVTFPVRIQKNEIAFLSANTWDVSGGGNYGYNSIWVNRNNNTFDNLDYVPKHQIKDLSKLLDII